tara:strand:+ start:808 stop:3288 length:2481 start_codon:yes stop_codon:yes gene_type:complete
MATTAHVGDTRALVFPVMCDGHLKIEYDDYNSNDLTGSNTIDESRHPLWDYGGPFSIEAIVTPYDVNGVGHRTSGQGRLDSTKTPPSPNLSLDDQADTTSNYESVSYFGAGRGTHKMMIFCNDYLKFYLQNTTSSNFNQPAEYKMVVELTDSVGTPIAHTVASEPVFVSKKSLIGYYDSDGLYSGITTDKTKITSSATGSLPIATAQVTGNLASFTNTAEVQGTATFTVDDVPGSSHLDTAAGSGTEPTGSVVFSSIADEECFHPGASYADNAAFTAAIDNSSFRVFNDGTTSADTLMIVCIADQNFPGSTKNGETLMALLNAGGVNDIGNYIGTGFGQALCLSITGTTTTDAANLRNLIGTHATTNISGFDLRALTVGSASPTVSITTTTGVSSTTLANYNQTITKGSNLSALSVSGMSGGVNASSGSNVNYYMTVRLRNSNGSLTAAKYFKFFSGTFTNGALDTNSTTSVSPVHKVLIGGNESVTATYLAGAINAAFTGTGFGGTEAAASGSVVTVTSPSNAAQSSQFLSRVSGYSSIITVSGSQFSNYSAASTPTAFITLEDSAGLVKKYKPTKGDNSETNGSTATEGSNDVVFFTNVVGNTQTTAQNLRTAINGSSGHNGSLTVSRSGSTLTIVAASAGDQAISNTGISSGLTIGAFSTNVNDINVGSGEADGIGAGNEIYNNVGTLIGTVSSVSGNTITLASAPATTVTGTIYREQQKEALYLEQPSKVGMSFDGNTITLYLNNQPVKRAKVNIGKFRLDTSPGDCFIGQNGTLSATARKATQFMGELYEIAFHKSATPCPTITTLTPNYSDTLFYYSFGD